LGGIMKYKIPNVDNPTLTEIAEYNDIQILGNMQFSKGDELYPITKHINKILFNLLWSNQPSLKEGLNQVILWLSIKCKMIENSDVRFHDCFEHTIFDKTYFGGMAFDGSQHDFDIIQNREGFIKEYGITKMIQIQRPINSKRNFFDHFEAYTNIQNNVIAIFSTYSENKQCGPFAEYLKLYHPRAVTYVAVFDNKAEYNKWMRSI
jgi:hypothetical protein